MELLGALYKLDPNLIATIITKESHGSPKATSGEAHGLMQITPDTAKGIASNYLNTALSTGDIWAPQPT
jgi:soluble lytic murein transglycosylase-like protein